ncbi:unnamed protein product [Schistosoma turkestanicum]|nr:unnamed protein product [Schistosoma turkestanicum]
MFDLCIRDIHHTIEYYILYEQGDHGPAVKRCYPSNLSDVFIERIIEFAFCCDDRRISVEEFVIVFTDDRGTLEFVFCYQPNERFMLCISSKLPWCECFHSLLSILWHHGLYRDVHWSIMEPFFSHLRTSIPPHLPIDRIQCANPFNPSMGFLLRIPTPQSPHYLNYIIEYYNALDLSLWIHIFVSLLLERSLLFCSRRLTKLTACALTAVSLLYPIQWAHSFYPLIPEKVLGVLECPVPFVAGIHICNLEKAKQHLSAGTRLVDLDSGQISVYKPSSDDLQTENLYMGLGTPKAIFRFLHHKLKEVQHQLNVTMNSKHLKNGDWKQVNGEIFRCFERLTHPFFELIVNLLGCYTECLTRPDSDTEVDLDALIACQSCPGLESFLKSMFESQTIQLFLDQRSRRPPDPKTDLFENRASQLRGQAKRTYHHKATASLGPIFTSSLSNITSSSTKYDTKLKHKKYNFGSPEWLQAKKIKNPGRICYKGLPESIKHVKHESAFTWNVLLSRKADQSFTSHKTNKSGSMDIYPKHAPVMARMQDMDYLSYPNRPNSCFANSTPNFASGTLLSRKHFFRDDQVNQLEIQTTDSRSSDSSLKSSSSPSNRFNSSDMEGNQFVKRKPPPRPPPPRLLHINDHTPLKNMHQIKSQTLINETKQSIVSSRNDFTKLNYIKNEKDTVAMSSSVHDKTCSLTPTRRKTCPSTASSLLLQPPPPLPPRPQFLSAKLQKRITSSLRNVDKCSNISMNGYLHDNNRNFDKQKTEASLCRPLKIPITTNSSNERNRCQFNGHSNGPVIPLTVGANIPPPLPPKKLSLKFVKSPLLSNPFALKSALSESNPNLLVTKYTTKDSKQLSLCERRAKRFQSLNDKNLQINSIKMTLPSKLNQNNNSVQSDKINSPKQQTSHESLSRTIDGLSLECQKSNCSTLSQSMSDIHSRSGSYYSIMETKTNPLNVSTKNFIPEFLLLSPKELSPINQDTNGNSINSSRHRLLVRLKYGTISPQRRSKSTTTVPNLTLHRAHTVPYYQLQHNNLFRTKSMNAPTANAAPIGFMESHSMEQC